MALVLDNKVQVKIGGKDYELCLPIKCVVKAERETVAKNLIVTITELENGPLCVEDTFTLFKYALIGGGVKADQAEELFLKLLEESSLRQVMGLVLDTLGKSGVFGRRKKE